MRVARFGTTLGVGGFMDPDVIAAAVLIIADMGDSAGRFARDCDRLAMLLRSLMGETSTGDPFDAGLFDE